MFCFQIVRFFCEKNLEKVSNHFFGNFFCKNLNIFLNLFLQKKTTDDQNKAFSCLNTKFFFSFLEVAVWVDFFFKKKNRSLLTEVQHLFQKTIKDGIFFSTSISLFVLRSFLFFLLKKWICLTFLARCKPNTWWFFFIQSFEVIRKQSD